MITIEVFGPGCHRCHATMGAVEEAVKALGISATILQINDAKEMARYRILFTPAVRVNGELKCTGRVPKAGEVAGWINAAGATKAS